MNCGTNRSMKIRNKKLQNLKNKITFVRKILHHSACNIVFQCDLFADKK